jgi:hypothetical protein
MMVPVWTETCRSNCRNFVLIFLWFYICVRQVGRIKSALMPWLIPENFRKVLRIDLQQFKAQWLLYVPLSLTFRHFCVPSTLCFVWISEQTAVVSLYSINWLVCITEMQCVFTARYELNLRVWLRLILAIKYSVSRCTPLPPFLYVFTSFLFSVRKASRNNSIAFWHCRTVNDDVSAVYRW